MRKKSIDNAYIDHYERHKISPVRQDISNIESHFHRRTNLYMSLGLLQANFRDKRVLEVGPGSGYNSLVIASWRPSLYVLVEPNKTGVSHIKNLFKQYAISMDKIEIANTIIEKFSDSEKYDIILCEGMIPGLSNKEQVLTKLSSLLKQNGVLVVTCADEISMFFEIIRYFFAYKLTKNIKTFTEKVHVAVDAFGSHLDTLTGFSRLKEDWCADTLFGYAHFNYDFSFKKCIEFFRNDYYVYKTSPCIFNDYRWYKTIPHDPQLFNQYYIEQFDLKKHNLLHYQTITPDRSKEENEELLRLCRHVVDTIYDGVRSENIAVEKRLLSLLELMIRNLRDTDSQIVKALKDIKKIITTDDYTIEAISSKYKAFISAFGRGQQYISLVKIKMSRR